MDDPLVYRWRILLSRRKMYFYGKAMQRNGWLWRSLWRNKLWNGSNWQRTLSKARSSISGRRKGLECQGVNFINILQAAFTFAEPKPQKTDDLATFFFDFGICSQKTACRTLMKWTKVSISPTFYEHIFCTIVFIETLMCLLVGF